MTTPHGDGLGFTIWSTPRKDGKRTCIDVRARAWWAPHVKWGLCATLNESGPDIEVFCRKDQMWEALTFLANVVFDAGWNLSLPHGSELEQLINEIEPRFIARWKA